MDNSFFSALPADLAQNSDTTNPDICIDFENARVLLDEFVNTEVSEETLADIAKSIVAIPSAIRETVAKTFAKKGDLERWSKENRSLISSVESTRSDILLEIAKKTSPGLKRKLSVVLDSSKLALSTMGTEQRLEEARYCSDAVLTGIMKGTETYMTTVKDNSKKLRKLLAKSNASYKIAIDTDGKGSGSKTPVDSVEDLKALRINVEADQKVWVKGDMSIESMIADWSQSAGSIGSILADSGSEASVHVGFVKVYAEYIKAGLELLDRYGLVRSQQELVANNIKKLYTTVSDNL